MLPKSEISELAEEHTLIILGEKVFLKGNENKNSEHRMVWVGADFPLYFFSTIRNLEQNYLEKYAKEIQMNKREYAEKLKLNQGIVTESIDKNDFLKFFFTTAMNFYRRDIKGRFGELDIPITTTTKNSKRTNDKPLILEVLSRYGENVGFFLRRMHPLQNTTNADPLIIIEGAKYGIRESPLVLEEFEGRFQEALETRIRQQVIDEISYIKEQKKELSKLERDLLRNIEQVEELRKNRYSYEYGSIGVDLQNNYFYWLHDSKTEKKRAMGTPLIKVGEEVMLGSPVNRAPMFRTDINEGFTISGNPCINITVPDSRDIKGVINYLNSCALTHYTS